MQVIIPKIILQVYLLIIVFHVVFTANPKAPEQIKTPDYVHSNSDDFPLN